VSHRSSSRTHGSMAVQYSLTVVVLGIALVATVGLARVVFTSFAGTTECFGVAVCPAATAAPSATVVPVRTVDALGNPIVVGCVVESISSADHGCLADADGDEGAGAVDTDHDLATSSHP